MTLQNISAGGSEMQEVVENVRYKDLCHEYDQVEADLLVEEAKDRNDPYRVVVIDDLESRLAFLSTEIAWIIGG